MSRFDTYKEMLKAILVDFHKKNPIKIGLSKEELRQRLPKVDYIFFQTALEETISQGITEVDKDRVRLKDIANRKDTDIETIKGQVITRLLSSGLTPPSLKELAIELKLDIALLREVMERLIYEGDLTKIKTDLYFPREVIDRLKQEVVQHIKDKGGLSPNDFKALFNVSRKYMIPLLEYLDEIRLTIRTGDIRVLRGNAL
jgi:selenocysteine-specific elongation factor